MAIKVNGTTVIDDSRNLSNVQGIKTVGGSSILGSGDISVGNSTSVGAVGTYAALHPTTNATRDQGATLAGSSLRYAGFFAYGSVQYNATSPSGTWQCMGCTGYLNGSASNSTDKQPTIWLRIS